MCCALMKDRILLDLELLAHRFAPTMPEKVLKNLRKICRILLFHAEIPIDRACPTVLQFAYNGYKNGKN